MDFFDKSIARVSYSGLTVVTRASNIKTCDSNCLHQHKNCTEKYHVKP